jgi:hypothetical protein
VRGIRLPGNFSGGLKSPVKAICASKMRKSVPGRQSNSRRFGAPATPVSAGPLSMYGFYVPEQDRAYIIDVAVTAVGKRKTDFINQLEIIAETFYIRQ